MFSFSFFRQAESVLDLAQDKNKIQKLIDNLESALEIRNKETHNHYYRPGIKKLTLQKNPEEKQTLAQKISKIESDVSEDLKGLTVYFDLYEKTTASLHAQYQLGFILDGSHSIKTRQLQVCSWILPFADKLQQWICRIESEIMDFLGIEEGSEHVRKMIFSNVSSSQAPLIWGRYLFNMCHPNNVVVGKIDFINDAYIKLKDMFDNYINLSVDQLWRYSIAKHTPGLFEYLSAQKIGDYLEPVKEAVTSVKKNILSYFKPEKSVVLWEQNTIISTNPYDVLEVKSTATEEEIRKSFRRLSIQKHPDKHPESEREHYGKEFQKISAAYEILSHADSRKKFDEEHMRQESCLFRK